LSQIEVGDGKVWVHSDKTALASAADAGANTEAPRVRGFVRNWRASRNKTANMYAFEIAL
jgi:hypothetical protein